MTDRPGLVDSVEVAIAAMTWLTPSDAGTVALAREFAAAIEGGDEKAIGWMGPHLMNVLRSLGGAPAERKALNVEEAVGGKLADLRLARQRNTKGGHSASA